MRISHLLFGLSLTIAAVTGASAATTYTYDTLGRLSTVCYDNGKEIIYSYDPAGNRSQVVIQGATCP
jgi:uncharacterized protein RhaS with RHS repeats